ncbi:MAG TPA: hypothetical protein VER96_31370 [Polyangiaceae bacterium]|nr:hypothetical protein [Polyangiaceae bacterium]
MSRTIGIDITLVNSTEKTVVFKDLKFDANDYESAPAFPSSLGPFTQLVIHAEAFYYRRNVPFSVQVVCDDAPMHLEQDPYHATNVIKPRQQGNLNFTLICLPTGNSYDLHLAVTETKYK